ncbi:MAG: TraR/DksA C4-type zinc finger protein [Alphaproteobacteria bacterium]|nr:TraR/DksA C4-type zinc finger protein [Alphaproteobacteria bacterium]MCB9930582.1 TraR/DksA C4-type zinc finger protein [Alphaproteobacteria bacterium]
MMDDAFFAEMRAALEARRAALTDLSRSTEADRAPVELDQTRMGRLSRMDALQGQEMAKAQDARRGQELQRITAALKRFDDDSYGLCLRCGDEIAEGRLRADPATPLCIACAER